MQELKVKKSEGIGNSTEWSEHYKRHYLETMVLEVFTINVSTD